MRFALSPNVTWPLFIVGLLLLSIGMCVSAVFAARSDGGAQTVPDYYTQALHYEQTLQAQAQSASAGWTVALEVGAETASLRTLTFTLSDAEGTALQDATGDVQLYHPSKTERVARVPFHTTDDGYAVRLPAMTPGLWDVTVTAHHGGVAFETTRRVEVL